MNCPSHRLNWPLIAKIPNRRRYRFTAHGVSMLSAVLAVHDEAIPRAYALAA